LFLFFLFLLILVSLLAGLAGLAGLVCLAFFFELLASRGIFGLSIKENTTSTS
jgi:hypothetical protein